MPGKLLIWKEFGPSLPAGRRREASGAGRPAGRLCI